MKIFSIKAVLLTAAVLTGGCTHTHHDQSFDPEDAGIRSISGTQPSSQPVPYLHRRGELSEEELQMAKTAWRYFENNYQPETGLVNAVDGYPSTTMWDSASYLGALVSAEKIGLIDRRTFSDRMTKFMRTMNNLNFFKGELPNKVYHTKTAEKVNYGNQPGEIGFSGIDLGRMLVWLRIIKETYPEQANTIDNFVLRWNFTNAIDKCGTIYGAMIGPDGKVQYVQEGRLGYEEYSAKGFQLWGFSSCLASRPEPFETEPMYCVDVPFDTRDPRKYSQHNYVVSESYVLDGIELGWDKVSDRSSPDDVHTDKMMENFAHRIYQVQENRHKATGILTARSEHQLDQAPYFVYDTIYSDGFPWNTITDTGKYVPEFAAISLKAALGMWALWDSPYTDLLGTAIWQQYVPEKGYYEGILENGKGPIKAFTANNNGIMLESLLYKKEGKLLKFNKAEPLYKELPPSLWDRQLTNPFEADNRSRGRPVITPDNGVLGSSDKKSWGGASCPLDSTGETGKCTVCPACSVCQDDTPVTLPAWSSCH
jgi:hypothetical protein